MPRVEGYIGFSPIPPSPPGSEGSSSPGNHLVTLPPWSKTIAIPTGSVRKLLRGLPVFMDSRRNLHRVNKENSCSTPVAAKGRLFYLGSNGTLRTYAGGWVSHPNGKPYQVFDYTGAAGMPSPVPRPRPRTTGLPNLYIDAGQFGGNPEEAQMYEDECGFIYKKADGEQPSYFYGVQDGQEYFLRRAEDRLQWVICQPVVNEATGRPYRVRIDAEGATLDTEDDCMPAKPSEPAPEAEEPAPAAPADTSTSAAEKDEAANRRNRAPRTPAEKKLSFEKGKAPPAPQPARAAAPPGKPGMTRNIKVEDLLDAFGKQLRSFEEIVKGEGKSFDELIARAKERKSGQQATVSLTEYTTILKSGLPYLNKHARTAIPKTAAGYVKGISDGIEAFQQASASLAGEGLTGRELFARLATSDGERLLDDWKRGLTAVFDATQDFYELFRSIEGSLAIELVDAKPRNQAESRMFKLQRGLLLILHEIEQEAKRVMLSANRVARSFYYHALGHTLLGTKDNVVCHAVLGADLYIQPEGARESKFFTCVEAHAEAAGEENNAPKEHFRVGERCFVLAKGAEPEEFYPESFERLFIDHEKLEKESRTITLIECRSDLNLFAWMIDTTRESIKDSLGNKPWSIKGNIDITLGSDALAFAETKKAKQAINKFRNQFPDIDDIVLIEV